MKSLHAKARIVQTYRLAISARSVGIISLIHHVLLSRFHKYSHMG